MVRRVDIQLDQDEKEEIMGTQINSTMANNFEIEGDDEKKDNASLKVEFLHL